MVCDAMTHDIFSRTATPCIMRRPDVLPMRGIDVMTSSVGMGDGVNDCPEDWGDELDMRDVTCPKGAQSGIGGQPGKRKRNMFGMKQRQQGT